MQYSNDFKEKCISEYLNGVDKKELISRYHVDMSTINAWIRKSKIPEFDLKLAKRAKAIPIEIQKEILKTLNSNALLKGFDISVWSNEMLKSFMKAEYNILTNRRTTTNLINDSRQFQNTDYEEKVFSDIDEMEKLGYRIILLDFLKIGKIRREEVTKEPFNPDDKQNDFLDVYLAIGRANDKLYIDEVYLEKVKESKNTKSFSIVQSIDDKSDKEAAAEKLRYNIRCKREILNKIIKRENRDVVFVTTPGNDIQKILRVKKYKFYIVEEELYPELIQSTYELDKAVLDYIREIKNELTKNREKKLHDDEIDKIILKIKKMYEI